MFLRLPPDLIDRLDLSAAVRGECQRPRTMLPSRVVEHALETHEDEYAQAVRARLRTGIDVDSQETVWAPKLGPIGRYRWLTALPMRERVLLRALVADLGVAPPDRSGEQFDRFQAAPLNDGHEYITVADVASYYFFIDHGLLEDRIVDASARADTAEAIRAVLSSIETRGAGLPQNFAPSDSLAEVFMSWVERRLARAGLHTYRHNDDFRIGSPTWGDGLRGLEFLGRELSNVGLELNGEKSWILTRNKYDENLRLAHELYNAAIPDSFQAVDAYTGEPLEPEGDDETPADAELLEISERVFEAASEARLNENDRMNGFELRANREIRDVAMVHFTRLRSAAGLEYGPALVAVEPAFAQRYAMYLAFLAESDQAEETSDRVLEVLERFGGYTPAWVQAWLIDPFLAPSARLSGAAKAWLHSLVASTAPSLLRGRAALGLAANEEISFGEVAALVDSVPSSVAPDIVAALGVLAPDTNAPEVKAVIESEHLYRWIFEYAAANADDCRWA